MSVAEGEPSWVTFQEPIPALRHVECGGRLGEEETAIYDPEHADEGHWLAAESRFFVDVEAMA